MTKPQTEQWTARFNGLGQGWIENEQGVEVFDCNPLAFDDPFVSVRELDERMMHALKLAAAAPKMFAALNDLLSAVVAKTDLGLCDDKDLINRAEEARALVTGELVEAEAA